MVQSDFLDELMGDFWEI